MRVAEDSTHFTSHNGMLFGVDDASSSLDLLLVPEGMEGDAVLPENVASVPACVFSRCTKLSAIVALPSSQGSTANSAFTSQDGILYTADKATLVAAPAGLGASANIAAECTTIASGAFWGNADLSTIVVSSTVETIAENAFSEAAINAATVALSGDFSRAAWEAVGFTKFTEPAKPGAQITPAEGSGYAFTLLDDMTLSVRWSGADPAPAALQIPDFGVLDGVRYSVSAVADGAFAGQTSVVTVDVPASVTRIGAGAFDGCSNLQTVRMGNGVRAIGERAFADTVLLSLVLPTDLAELGAQALAGLNGTTVVALHEVANVAEDVLLGTAGASVYVPAGTEGNWVIGAPALGNHLYPYGVQLPSGAMELAAGESAPLFGEGALQAPGTVQVEYAYKAKSLSIGEDGTVEAKQPGTTQVTATLTIPVQEVVVKGVNSADVRLKKASTAAAAAGEDAGIETVTLDTPITLASAAQPVNVSPVGSSRSYSEGYIEYVNVDCTVKLKDGSTDTRFIQLDGVGAYWNWGITVGADTVYAAVYEDMSSRFDPCDNKTLTIPNGYAFNSGYYTVYDNKTDIPVDSGELFSGEIYSTFGSSSNTVYVGVNLYWDVTLTWHPNGGYWGSNTSDTGTKTSTHIYGNGPISGFNGSSIPKRTGYTFNGWATSSTAASGSSSFNPINFGSTNAYATWKINSYNITWNPNGGYWGTNTSDTGNKTSSHNYNASVSGYNGSTKPSRTGYTFLGWATSDSATTGSSSVKITSSRTYYAVWEIASYQLFWYSGEGYWPDDPNKETHIEITTQHYYGEDTYGPTPERPGYYLNGWLHGTNWQSLFEPDLGPWLVTQDAYFEAEWMPNDYTIAFNSNGGSGSTNSMSVLYDGTYTLNECKFTRAGYTFQGWTTVQGGTEVQYANKASVKNLTTERGKTVTMYAVWKANTITLTWNTHGGSSVANTTQEYASTSKVVLPTSTPTREGYEFAGWWTAENGGTQVTTGSMPLPTTNTTYHAHWTGKTITLTWDSQGGSAVANTTQTYSENAKVNLPTEPTRSGYTFLGWFWSPTDDTMPILSTNKLPSQNETYYAHWSQNLYYVDFHGNDADDGSMERVGVLYGEIWGNIPKNKFTRTGYTFQGWSRSINATTPEYKDEATMPTTLATGQGDVVTFYAVWKVNTYNITASKGTGVNTISSPSSYTYDRAEQTFTVTATANAGYDANKLTLTALTEGIGFRNNGSAEVTVSIAPGLTRDVAFQASLGFASCKVTWDPNGGYWDPDTSDTSAKTSDHEYNVSTSGYQGSIKPKRAGYTFLGWKTDLNSGGYVQTIYPKSDMTVYAVWRANTITVKWNTDANTTWKTTTQTYSDGSKLQLPENMPAKKGYVFTGWYESDSWNAKQITADTPLPATDTTYYARFNFITYFISFDGDGAEEGSMELFGGLVYGDIDVYLPPNRFVSYGQTFQGWSWTLDGSGSVDYIDEAEIPIEDLTKFDNEAGSDGRLELTLHAVWKTNTYTIAFDGGEGATGSTASMSMTYGTPKNLTANGFTKTGYEFQGWSTTKGGTTVDYKPGASVNNLTAENGATVTLYAVWKINVYATTWEPNGGYWVNDEGLDMAAGADYEYGAKVFGPDLEPNLPSRVGYIFDGWTNVDTGKFYDVSHEDELIEIIGPATFRAEWLPIGYYIAYDGNGATSGHMATSSVWIYDEEPCPLRKNEYERTGYTFQGWSLDKDSGKVDYLDEQEVTNLTTENNATVTLYAVWAENEEASYTIEHYFENLDGGYDCETQTVPGKTHETVSVEPLEREGFWFDEHNASNVLEGEVKSDNSLVLKVYYFRQGGDVRYWYDDSLIPDGVPELPETVNYKYGQTVKVADKPSIDGYTFDGWYGTSGDKDIAVDDDGTFTMVDDDVTFTGTWTANEAKIIFDANGGEKADDIDLTGKTGEALASTALPSDEQVKKVGWALAGWYDNADLSGDALTSLPERFPAGTTTYYAKWTPILSVTAPVKLTLTMGKSNSGLEGAPATAQFVSHTPVDGTLALQAGLSAEADKDGNTHAVRLQNVRDIFTDSADSVAVQFADAADAEQCGSVPLTGVGDGTGVDGLLIKPAESKGVIYSLDLSKVDTKDVQIPEDNQAKSIALLRFVFSVA